MPGKLSTLATPRTEFDDRVRFLPLATVTLKRSCPPPKVVDAPSKVIVPPEAVSLPVPPNDELMVRLLVVDVVPVIARPAKVAVPLFEINLSVPDIVRVPPLAESELPESTVRLPLTGKVEVVVTVPLMVKLLNTVELPVLVIDLSVPVITTVLVLPVKVPLDVQLPATVCVAFPPLKVALEELIITSPFTVIFAAAVDVAEPVLVKLPAMVIADAGSVLIPDPERVKLP